MVYIPSYRKLHNGYPIDIVVDVPIAGADWEYIVPVGTRFTPIYIQASFHADANVATREIQTVFELAFTYRFRHQLYVGIVANQIMNINLGAGLAGYMNTARNDRLTQGLCYPVNIPGGNLIQSITGNIQAGDQWTNIYIHGIQYEDQD